MERDSAELSRIASAQLASLRVLIEEQAEQVAEMAARIAALEARIAADEGSRRGPLPNHPDDNHSAHA